MIEFIIGLALVVAVVGYLVFKRFDGAWDH